MSVVAENTSYAQRSLQHERRMIVLYRERAGREPSLWQPLANACRRAACFEWHLNPEAEAVTRLWSEAARIFAQGWTTRRSGFAATPNNFTLALHLAIAARESDVFIRLAHLDAALRTPPANDGDAVRGFRTLIAHAQSYGFIARALVTGDFTALEQARAQLNFAISENRLEWWEREYPDALEAAWRFHQHVAECRLLSIIARHIKAQSDNLDLNKQSETPLNEMFVETIDETLTRLFDFISDSAAHHPKLFLWLPGIALCRFAASSKIDLSLIADRRAIKPDVYAVLPNELLSLQT